MKLDPGMHIVMHLVFFEKNRCDSMSRKKLSIKEMGRVGVFLVKGKGPGLNSQS
jgi:hypothetical protein